MTRPFRWLVLSGLVLITAIASLWLVDRRISARRAALPVLGQVSEFAVTNQAGVRLESDQFKGSPYAVDVIFTRCPGPCLKLSGVMRSVQERLPQGSSARLMSITSDPEHDTPEVLSGYAAKFGADARRWQFVTASRSEVRHLVTGQFLLVLQDKPADKQVSATDLFIHSTLIVVVDGMGRLRCAVEGLEEGAAEKVAAVLRQLETED